MNKRHQQIIPDQLRRFVRPGIYLGFNEKMLHRFQQFSFIC